MKMSTLRNLGDMRPGRPGLCCENKCTADESRLWRSLRRQSDFQWTVGRDGVREHLDPSKRVRADCVDGSLLYIQGCVFRGLGAKCVECATRVLN